VPRSEPALRRAPAADRRAREGAAACGRRSGDPVGPGERRAPRARSAQAAPRPPARGRAERRAAALRSRRL